MRVTNMLPGMQYQMQQSQQALSTALEQLSTGLRVTQLSDDPVASANMIANLDLSARVDQYTKNATSITGQMQTADASLGTVFTAINSAVTLGTEAGNSTNTASNEQSIATQLEGILNTVIGQANEMYQGSYLFGGTATTSAPFVPASSSYASTEGSASTPLSTSTSLTAGSTTTISDAATGQTWVYTASGSDNIGSLMSAVNAAGLGVTATINSSGKLEMDSTTGIVVSSDDSALGSMTAAPNSAVANAYAYVGNDGINQVQVGESVSVPTNVPGSELFGSGTGLIPALTGLINAVKTGTPNQIITATTAVSTALSQFNAQRIPLGNTISQVNSQESYLSQETVTLKTQQTSLVGISISDAATNVAQAELQHNAVLAAASKIAQNTLLDYLK